MVAVGEKPEKFKDAVRTARFEVAKIESGDSAEVRKRWWGLCDQTRQVTNCIWQTWLVWHTKNGTADKLRTYLDALAAWRKPMQDWEQRRNELHKAHVEAGGSAKSFRPPAKPKQDKKPKCEVYALDADCNKAIYDELARRFPLMNTAVREQIRNTVSGKIKNRQAAKGNLSGWMAILLCNESLPSTTRPIPIPFPSKCATLIPPMEDRDNFRLRIRVDRIPPADGKVKGSSTEDQFQLLTKKRGIARYEKLLHQMIVGEVEFSNASLSWDSRKKKWFCLIGYKLPVLGKTVKGDKTAILYPNDSEAKAPWTIEIGERKIWRGGNGSDVAHTRTRVLSGRWGRQDTYRYAGSANKGHGRNRAMKGVFRLSKRWKDFVKTKNQIVAKQIIDDCFEHGCATLVYRQPIGEARGKMMLAMAGKIEGRHDSTGWDWQQIKGFLQDKCNAHGIHLIVEKSGSDEDAEAETV